MSIAESARFAVDDAGVTISLPPASGAGRYALSMTIDAAVAQPRKCGIVSVAYRRKDGTRIDNPLRLPMSRILGTPYRYLGALKAGQNKFTLNLEIDRDVAEVILAARAWAGSPGFNVTAPRLVKVESEARKNAPLPLQAAKGADRRTPLAAERAEAPPRTAVTGLKAVAGSAEADTIVLAIGKNSTVPVNVYPVEAGHHYAMKVAVQFAEASEKALLLRVAFEGTPSAAATRPAGFSFSPKNGLFCYLRTGDTHVRFIAPPGATAIRTEVVAWELSSASVTIPKRLTLTKMADGVVGRIVSKGVRQLIAASAAADLSVLIYTGTKRIGEGGRANRSMMFARELEVMHAPVFYTYVPTEGELNFAADSDNLMQLPLSQVEQFAEQIASGVTAKQRLFIASLPDERCCRLVGLFRFHGWRIVYECRDEWEEFAAVGAAAWYSEAYERFLVTQAERTFCVSPALVAKMRTYDDSAGKIVLSPNGTTGWIIQEGERYRAAVRAKTKPRDRLVGYFGHLTDQWFDWSALGAAARELSDVNFELIGFDKPDIPLPPNVAYLGSMPQSEILSIAPRWSVGLIPFKPGKLSRAADPIKIYEYLALGLNVAATPMGTIDQFPMTFCYEEFGLTKAIVRALEYAPSEADVDAAEAILAQSTWAARLTNLVAGAGLAVPGRQVEVMN